MPPSKAKAHLARARAAKLTKKLQKQSDGLEFPLTENPGTDCQNAALPVVPIIRGSSPEGKQNLAASSTQETLDVDVPADEAVSSYALIDLSSLDKIVSELSCNACCEKLALSCERRAGAVLMLQVTCSKCNLILSSTATSKTLKDSNHYDVNRRLVTAFEYIGQGHDEMEVFCEVMGIEPMQNKTYESHLNAIRRKKKKRCYYK